MPRTARILMIVTTVATLFGLTPSTSSATSMTEAMAATPVADEAAPVDTVNPFYPEDRDLSDCLGTLERPGCGSESRGGLHQNLVAIAMIGGLLLVFGRVAWGVRKSQQRHQSPTSN